MSNPILEVPMSSYQQPANPEQDPSQYPSWAWGQQAQTSYGSTLTGMNGIGFVTNPGTGEQVAVAIPPTSSNSDYTIPSPSNNTGEFGFNAAGPGVAIPMMGSTLYGGISSGGLGGNITNDPTNTNTFTPTNTNTNTFNPTLTNTNTNNNQSSATVNISNPNPGPGQAARALGQLASPPSFTPPNQPGLPSVPQTSYQGIPGYSAPNLMAVQAPQLTTPQAGPVTTGSSMGPMSLQGDTSQATPWNIQGGNSGGGGLDSGSGMDPQMLEALTAALNRPQYVPSQMLASGSPSGSAAIMPGTIENPNFDIGAPDMPAAAPANGNPSMGAAFMGGISGTNGYPTPNGQPSAGQQAIGSAIMGGLSRGGHLDSPANVGRRKALTMVPPPPPDTPTARPELKNLNPDQLMKLANALFPTAGENSSPSLLHPSEEDLQRSMSNEWKNLNDEADQRFAMQLYDARKEVEYNAHKVRELSGRLEQLQAQFYDVPGRQAAAMQQARQMYQRPNLRTQLTNATRGMRMRSQEETLQIFARDIYAAQENGLKNALSSVENELGSYHKSAQDARMVYHDSLKEKQDYIKQGRQNINDKYNRLANHTNAIAREDVARSMNNLHAFQSLLKSFDNEQRTDAYNSRTDAMERTAADRNQTTRDFNNGRLENGRTKNSIDQQRANTADANLAERQNWHQFMAPIEAANSQSRALSGVGLALNGVNNAGNSSAKEQLGSFAAGLTKPMPAQQYRPASSQAQTAQLSGALSSKILEFMQDHNYTYDQAVGEINAGLQSQGLRFNPRSRQVESLR